MYIYTIMNKFHIHKFYNISYFWGPNHLYVIPKTIQIEWNNFGVDVMIVIFKKHNNILANMNINGHYYGIFQIAIWVVKSIGCNWWRPYSNF
jgi:hypothetical protein